MYSVLRNAIRCFDIVCVNLFLCVNEIFYKETHAKRCAVMSDEVMEATVSLAVQKCVEQKQPDLNITFSVVNRCCAWISSRKP